MKPANARSAVRRSRQERRFRWAPTRSKFLGLKKGYHGTHFGGSLYAMTDPFFALMVIMNLPDEYLVWDRSASVEFIAPGRTRMRATFTLEADDLDRIVRMTEGGDKHLHLFRTDVVDDEGLVVAKVEKIVYVRRRRSRA